MKQEYTQIIKQFREKFKATKPSMGGITYFWKLKPNGSFVSPDDVESFLTGIIAQVEEAATKEAYEAGKFTGTVKEQSRALQILLSVKHGGHGGGNWRRLIDLAIDELHQTGGTK